MSKKKPDGGGVGSAVSGALARAVEGLLPEIRGLIEEARHRAVTAANLSMVTLYWNVGRVITRELQRNAKRAGYGEGLLGSLAERLAQEYGRGFSRPNLQDMRRFYDGFEICQPVASKLLPTRICQPPANKPVTPLVRSAHQGGCFVFGGKFRVMKIHSELSGSNVNYGNP